MKISVIVPVYNVEEYLSKCLDSLVNQTIKEEYEIIVVNDGSPDHSQAIIDEYVSKYPNKVFGYKKENGGLSSARNFGMEKARGEYFSFVDSDDYVKPEFLEELYNKIIQDNYDMVICDCIEKSEDFENIIPGVVNKSDDMIKNCILSYPNAWTKLYKRELFLNNNIKYPDRIYYEDLATTPRLLINCNKVGYVNKPLYYYMVRTNSITHQTKYNPKTKDVFTAIDITTKYFKEKNVYDKYKDEIEYLNIIHILHSYIIRIYNYEEAKVEISNVYNYIKENYPDWKKNKYYKKENIKFKIVCSLIYNRKLKLVRKILNRNK